MLCCYAPPAHALYVADNDWAWPDSKSSGDPSHGPAHPATGSRNGLSLLDLDLDLIGLILDRLKILDLFFLSHTCCAMRVLTRRDWALAVAQATKEERFEFWLDLAWMTPIRKNSLLSPVWDEVRNGAARKSSSFASWIATSFHSRISAASRSMYCLNNVNMQMAWALARMPKEGYHAQLSEVIAQGREFVEVLLRPRVREHRIGPVRRRETVAAKLLQGLLVSVEVDYYNQQSPISFEDFEEYFPDVCLHMGVKRKHESTTSDFLWSIASDSRTAFTKDLRSALDTTGSEIQGFCMLSRGGEIRSTFLTHHHPFATVNVIEITTMSSLILRSRSSLTPEMRLVKATSEFEAALTTVQKASFRNIRSKACTTPPTLKDVMELTAEIDCQARKKHKSSWSFGTRLTNMLQSVQQYAALGDVVVGGSQNLIACGVGAAVRMVLHMSIGYLSHLEKLSMLFMEAGRQAPRYQALALIYPKSKNLQNYLFEYYVVVVELCQTIQKFAQQSTFGKMMSSINDSDLKGFQSDLQLCKWSDSAAHRQDVTDRIRWLEAHSTYDFQTTWKQTRKIGSASFLSNWTQYGQWKSNDMGSAMLLSGKLGSGKSVTMANVVDDLNLEDNTLVIYFFCRHDLPESLKSHNIIGSLTRQYLSHFPIGSDIFKADLTTIDAAGFGSIVDNPVPNKKKFLLIDGLDECDQGELRSLLQALATVHRPIRLRTPILNVSSSRNWTGVLPDGQLTIGDDKILPEIRHALITGAKGMFLWVSLQLNAICDEASDDAMREVLKTLPSDLTETYIRILRKASAQDNKKYHIRLFKFIAGAYEPLSLGQIQELAAVINGSPVWDPQKQINDVTKVLRYCGSLVVIDEEESTVRFVHHSARSFCQGALGGNLDWHFSDGDAHREIGEIVVTYLSYGIFDTRLSSRVIPKVEVQKLPEHVIQNAIGHSRLSKSFFKLKQGPSRDIGQVLAKVSQQPDGGKALAQHPFLAYARKFWLLHTRNLNPLARDTFKLWESLIKKEDIHQLDRTPQIPGPLDDFEPTHEHPLLPALSWAINHSHLPLFNFLMDSRHDYVMSFRFLLQKLLFLRAVFKHLSLKHSDLTGPLIESNMIKRLLPIAVRVGADTAVGWMAHCVVSSGSRPTFIGNTSDDSRLEMLYTILQEAQN
ncbi:hypothetical protein CPLU01_07970 [Colletotrichum plurivorum]|uniref:NACHT domain-containing protein n=1 Tax=Colletotrichum plurivorum TaxID=2175906 RepID=A0A8H6KE77_9PEZI|nr:hypothetical protein CPLU01_07970 [Colletotrichum plurivorum]